LCSADAWQLFRVAVFGTPAPVIMVSTDGFANSFRDDEGYFRFGSDVLRILIMEGVEMVGGRLSGWLGEMTQTGSGDDISLAIACRPSEFPESLPELISQSDIVSSDYGGVSSQGPGHEDSAASQDATVPGAPDR
jgi:hypothetical protein